MKLIKDLTKFMEKEEEIVKMMGLFNPKPRTLLLLVYAYYEGKIS